MFCTNCGEKIAENALYCSFCGYKVVIETITSDQEVVEVFEEENVSDLKDIFVGKNSSFYKYKWERMERKNTNVSSNFAAFFFNVFWLGYRKMYKVLFIVVGLYLVLDFLLINVFNYQYFNDYIDPVDRIIGFVTSIILAMYGNKLYQRHVEKSVNKIKANSSTKENAESLAKQKGGRSWFGVFLTAMIFVVYGAISVWLVPSNLDYISFVRDGSFYDYPRETVGEAFDAFFDTGDWEYVSTSTAFDIVLFTGELRRDGKDFMFEIEFIIEDESFDIREIVVNRETFRSTKDIARLLDIIYEN